MLLLVDPINYCILVLTLHDMAHYFQIVVRGFPSLLSEGDGYN